MPSLPVPSAPLPAGARTSVDQTALLAGQITRSAAKARLWINRVGEIVTFRRNGIKGSITWSERVLVGNFEPKQSGPRELETGHDLGDQSGKLFTMLPETQVQEFDVATYQGVEYQIGHVTPNRTLYKQGFGIVVKGGTILHNATQQALPAIQGSQQG